MTMAASKKVRRAVVNGTEHTDASLAAMKTVEIAGLVAAIRGDGQTPKPATKAKAIELFWKAAESLPKAPEVPEVKAEAPEAKKTPKKVKKDVPEAAPKVRRYAIEINGPEKLASVQEMTPIARRFAEEIKAAGRPLSMAECAAILGRISKSKRPEKFAAWHFCKLFRPAGILIESRG